MPRDIIISLRQIDYRQMAGLEMLYQMVLTS